MSAGNLFQRGVSKIEQIPGTKAHYLYLDCGHRVMSPRTVHETTKDPLVLCLQCFSLRHEEKRHLHVLP